MSATIFICCIALIIQLTLGIIVFIKGPQKKPNQTFSIQLFLFFLWTLAELNLTLNGISELGVRLLFTPGVLLAYFFCIFSAIYPEADSDSFVLKAKRNKFILLIPAGVLLYLIWTPGLLINLTTVANGFSFKFGKMEFFAKGIIIGYLFLALSTLSRSGEKATSRFQIKRFRYTFTAMLLPIAAGSIFIALSKLYIGNLTIYTFGLFPLLSIVMGAILAYTMLKYNLMEIDLIFSIGLVYTLLTIILAGSMELLQEFMQNLLNLSGLWAKIGSTLFIAGLFSPLKDLLNKLVDKFFGRHTFDSAHVMQHILTEVRKKTTPEQILERFLKELHLVIDYSFATVKLNCNTIKTYPGSSNIIPEQNIQILPDVGPELETQIDFLKQNNLSTKLHGSWKSSGYRLAFEIGQNENSKGICYFGPKNSKVPYSANELTLISGICQEIPHIINNLKLLDDLLTKDRNTQEIVWARKMLQTIAAPNIIQEFEGYQLQTYSSLSPEIKGDLIDVNLTENNLFLGLYDADHHGIKAALTLVILYSTIRSGNLDNSINDCEQALKNFAKLELTSAITLIQPKNNQLQITNVGNPPILRINKDQVTKLDSANDQLLGKENKIKPTQVKIKLDNQKDWLLIPTQGLFNAFSKTTYKSLENFLKEIKFSSISDLHKKLIKQLSKIPNRVDFQDDITYIILGNKNE